MYGHTLSIKQTYLIVSLQTTQTNTVLLVLHTHTMSFWFLIE